MTKTLYDSTKEQVCNELFAKQLKHLKIKQTSTFYWVREKTNLARNFRELMIKRSNSAPPFGDPMRPERFIPLDPDEYYSSFTPKSCTYESAFTAAELGKMLMCHKVHSVYTRFYGYGRGWLYDEAQNIEIRISHDGQGLTEADARAKMLIYLLENGLISAEDINLAMTA